MSAISNLSSMDHEHNKAWQPPKTTCVRRLSPVSMPGCVNVAQIVTIDCQGSLNATTIYCFSGSFLSLRSSPSVLSLSIISNLRQRYLYTEVFCNKQKLYLPRKCFFHLYFLSLHCYLLAVVHMGSSWQNIQALKHFVVEEMPGKGFRTSSTWSLNLIKSNVI